MPQTSRDLLAAARRTVRELTPPEVREVGGRTLIDVREQDEWDQGHIPGAIHLSKGYIEMRIEETVPERSTPITLYCAAGIRSLFAAQALDAMGYHDVASMSGGFGAWKQAGYEFVIPRTLTAEQKLRYSRHLLMPEVGEEGQARLLEARVLLIGTGGLGSPGGALPGRGGRRDHWAGRLRHRRRQQPPAPDPAHPGSDRDAEDPVREDRPQRAEPGRPGGRARRGPHQRERPPPLPPVRRDRQRLRQLPDPLPGQRRGHLRAQAAGRRRNLPLRGPGVHHRPLPLALLPLPLPRAAASRGGSVLRRGGGARGAARDRRGAPGDRGDQADPRASASR